MSARRWDRARRCRSAFARLNTAPHPDVAGVSGRLNRAVYFIQGPLASMAAAGTSGTDQGSLTARPYLPALAPDRIAGSDLLVSAFIAALSHYKRATVALPFPSELFCVQPASGAREKDFEAAQRAAEAVPSLRSLADSPCTGDAAAGTRSMGVHAATLPEAAHQLLEWLLVPSTRRAPALRHISMQHLQSQLQQARPGWQFDPPRESTPTYAFQVQPQGSSPCTPLSSPIIAFHGTSFERLHSILSTGLQPGTGTRLQRNGSIFGEGIYLSTDYGVAFRCAQNSSSANPQSQFWEWNIQSPFLSTFPSLVSCPFLSHQLIIDLT